VTALALVRRAALPCCACWLHAQGRGSLGGEGERGIDAALTRPPPPPASSSRYPQPPSNWLLWAAGAGRRSIRCAPAPPVGAQGYLGTSPCTPTGKGTATAGPPPLARARLPVRPPPLPLWPRPAPSSMLPLNLREAHAGSRLRGGSVAPGPQGRPSVGLASERSRPQRRPSPTCSAPLHHLPQLHGRTTTPPALQSFATPSPFGVAHAQVELSICIARLSCTAVPRHCLLCILGNAFTVIVAYAQVELRSCSGPPQLHGGTTTLPALHPWQPRHRRSSMRPS